MNRALELAERGRGKVRDHPLVGAVLVAGGEVVGEGWYEYDAVDHAETVALAEAGERARGGTMYVTLEPCAHHGRTPPCADAVAAAGVARVVVGALDPNPKAAGGVERLRAAGVEVDVVESADARRQNEAWRTWVALGRPHVTYKAAITLDGRVTVPGRRWVSGGEARRRRRRAPRGIPARDMKERAATLCSCSRGSFASAAASSRSTDRASWSRPGRTPRSATRWRSPACA